MVGPVSDSSVTVPPAEVPRNELLDDRSQILIRPGADLEQGDAGCGMRNEDRQEAVTIALATEAAGRRREVGERSAAGFERQLFGVHGP